MATKRETNGNKVSFREYQKRYGNESFSKKRPKVRTKKVSKNVSTSLVFLASILIISLGSNVGIWNVRYTEGSENGYTLGRIEGYDKGKLTGYSSGYEKGFDVGLVQGSKSGYSNGFFEGQTDGYSMGYEEGNSTGYNFGFVYGKSIGYDEGYIQGLIDGVGRGYNIRDPSYKEVLSFIQKDKTDRLKYSDDFVCLNFAINLKTNSFNEGFRCLIVLLSFSDANIGHAIVVFNTTDKGLIYVEPQSDNIVTVNIGQKYWGEVIEDILLIP